MSTLSSGSTATQPRPRSAHRLSEATRRARLTVVPRRRVPAPRVPFVTLVSALLVGGVVGLLCFNTQMQQASFTTTTLEERATNLSARQQTLEMELEELRSPNQVNAAAQEAGLVYPRSSALLALSTGVVTGEAAPADAANTPPLEGRGPVRPAELSPPPNTTYVQAPADQAALADA
ncbi:MAG: hypothetical protein LH468_08880, partial [Nocardioides sp.]|nr:hypothetical protein [Nocardioides sp.]